MEGSYTCTQSLDRRHLRLSEHQELLHLLLELCHALALPLSLQAELLKPQFARSYSSLSGGSVSHGTALEAVSLARIDASMAVCFVGGWNEARQPKRH